MSQSRNNKTNNRDKVCVNLGCFDKKIPGFINVDARAEVKPDVVDTHNLASFEKNSVDLIYCCHMLEHLTYRDSYEALERWYDVLKVGGILRLAVPDIEAAVKYYYLHYNLPAIRTMLWGSQLHEFDYHYHGWDFATLKSDLNRVGFKGVRRWDWRTTPPHNYIDDYSQAYLPNMDKVNGMLMSLNVEGTK